MKWRLMNRCFLHALLYGYIYYYIQLLWSKCSTNSCLSDPSCYPDAEEVLVFIMMSLMRIELKDLYYVLFMKIRYITSCINILFMLMVPKNIVTVWSPFFFCDLWSPFFFLIYFVWTSITMVYRKKKVFTVDHGYYPWVINDVYLVIPLYVHDVSVFSHLCAMWHLSP